MPDHFVPIFTYTVQVTHYPPAAGGIVLCLPVTGDTISTSERKNVKGGGLSEILGEGLFSKHISLTLSYSYN